MDGSSGERKWTVGVKVADGFDTDTTTQDYSLLELNQMDSTVRVNRLGAPSSNNIQLFGGSGDSYPYINVTSAGRFDIKTDTSTAMSILSSGGNVGVGTVSPSSKFEVRQTTTSTVLIASSSATAGNTIAVQSSNGTGAGINFRSDGGHNRGRIYYDGSMTLDNADDAARPVKITTGISTAASGKDSAIIRIAPSGSTSGYFNAHGGVALEDFMDELILQHHLIL